MADNPPMNENYTKLVALLESLIGTANFEMQSPAADESHRWQSDQRADHTHLTLVLDDAQDEITLRCMAAYSMFWKVTVNFNDVPFTVIEAMIRAGIES